MSHPQIPEGHPRFEEADKDEWLFAVSGGANNEGSNYVHDVPIEDLVGFDRQDCAAHAAAWWFERAADESEHSINTHEYKEIARAWLAWGRGESEDFSLPPCALDAPKVKGDLS